MKNFIKIISVVLVAAMVATLAVAFAGCNNTTVQGMEDFPAMINALNTKAIDGYVAEEPGAIENCASNSDFTYIHLENNTTGFTATKEDTAIAVGLKQGSAMTAQVNAALGKISKAERDQMMETAISYATGANVDDDAEAGLLKDNNYTENTGDKLYVGLECAYAPFNFTQIDDSNGAVQIYDAKGNPVAGKYANGYDVMIAKKIAADMGKELVIVKLEWDALIPALKAGTINMIIAGMSPTAERKLSIDFSDEYYTSQLVVVVRKDGKYASAKTLDDLKGANITAQQGTFHLDALNAWLKKNK
jgi:ABC-type amino acid transport substrate-binding protein